MSELSIDSGAEFRNAQAAVEPLRRRFAVTRAWAHARPPRLREALDYHLLGKAAKPVKDDDAPAR